MSEEQSDTDRRPDAEASREPSPGAQLKEAREKAGLALEEIARELNLTVSRLEDLEADRYDKLPSRVFVQGYVRRYAGLLELDQDHLLRRLDDFLPPQPPPEEEARRARRGVSLPVWLIPAVLVLAAALVAAFLLLRGDGDAPAQSAADRSSSPEAPAVGEAGDEPVSGQAISESGEDRQRPAREESESLAREEEQQAVAAGPEQEAPTPTVEQPSQLAPPGEGELAGDATGDESQSPSAETAAAPPDSADILSFRFNEDCWVEVEDAAGEEIHADLETAGDTLTLEGRAPFTVMLGNAAGVSLAFNGEDIDVAPGPGNRTARLDVGS